MPIATPVVQFGTSRFLQAHADLFIHEAAQAGQEAGPVTIVAGSGSPSGRSRLQAFNDREGYPVIIRGLEAGEPMERRIQVRSIVRGIDAEADWADLTRIFVQEAAFVISNTTEAGFAVPHGLRLDLTRPSDAAPPGFPARLLALLAVRFLSDAPGLTILPTELVGRNGDTLKGIVLALARDNGASGAFLHWIESECVFANSLVDRIVSAPLDPAGAVAEPYALWAIEAQPGLTPPCAHPCIKVVENLEPFERLKIHILNLGHTVLAEHWAEAALPPGAFVRELLADRAIAAMLDGIYEDEVLPGFAARQMRAEGRAYLTTTLERFRNPFLDHRLSDIYTNHAAKVLKRVGEFVRWSAEAGAPPMPRLAAIAAKYRSGL